jgi:pimeloyl-ACP methyl ester carboxylesterase
MRTYKPPYFDELVAEAGMMHPANFSGNARLISDWRMDGQLRSYTNPVLVASGDRDTIVPPSSAEATARAFPNGSYVRIQNAGHSPQIEAPRNKLRINIWDT